MKKFFQFVTLLGFFLSAIQSHSQTVPSAYNLSTGSYSFTEWPITSAAMTYPTSMMFHRSATQDPGINATMTTDYVDSYILTSGPRINALAALGFGFINTGTNGNLGAAVLALNTNSCSNIQVSWTGRTILTGVRVYAIALQYSIGTSGTWINLTSEYPSNATAGHSTVLPTVTLPLECEGQNLVTLRWKYYYISGSGTRPQLAVDDISVTATTSGPTPPTVTTSAVNAITTTTATCGGEVTMQGSSVVLERGICWATTSNPTVDNNKVVCGSGLGTFSTNLSGLVPNTNYYVRAYAINATGTNYGINTPFKTQKDAWVLANGNYNFSEWAASSPAGTFPPYMSFRWASGVDPGITTEMEGDWTLGYDSTSKTRINGLGSDGISFINTSSKQTGAGYLGEAVLSLNTVNMTNIFVSWIGGFIDLAGTSSRDYRIRMQYRIGSTGTFNDVYDNYGNLIEYQYPAYINASDYANVPVNNQYFITKLPFQAENQSYIEIRWKYYQFAANSGGNRPRMRLDDISVSGASAVGTPTRLAITQVLPEKPMVDVNFGILVRSVDSDGNPKNVAQNTDFVVTRAYGTGTLTGTVTGTIPAGSNLAFLPVLSYNVAERAIFQAARSVGDNLFSGTKQIIFNPKPTLEFDIYTKGHAGATFPSFRVLAKKANGSIEQLYDGYSVTLVFSNPPGTITGTITKTMFDGVAIFDDLKFLSAGTYIVKARATSLSDSPDQTIIIQPAPAFSEIIVPKYIKGNGAVGTRIPSYALIEISNLHPNTIYHYCSGAYTSGVTTDIGAANNIHFNELTQAFWYNTGRNKDLYGSDSISTFKTDAGQTTKRIWINIVPTTNSAFAEGTDIYWILGLGYENGGLITRYNTTNKSKALDFGTLPGKATGIADRKSWITERNYVCLYAETTGGSAVSTAVAERIGAEVLLPPTPPAYPDTSFQAAPYFQSLERTSTSWATILPNKLITGTDSIGNPIYQESSIKRIEEYSPAGVLLRTWTDDNGIWAGINTRNVVGGMNNPIYFETPQIELLSPFNTDQGEICSTFPQTLSWKAHGVQKVNIQISTNNGVTYTTLVANVDGITRTEGEWQYGEYQLAIPANTFSGLQDKIRIVSVEHSYIQDESGSFSVTDPPVIKSQSKSMLYCLGENTTLQVTAEGPSISYQWYRDDLPIAGATARQYVMNNLNFTYSAIYKCVVTGVSACPIATTEPILVYVVEDTKILEQPQNQVVTLGENAIFKVNARVNGAPPDYFLDYQWFKGSTPLTDKNNVSGSKSNILRISNATDQDVANNYHVVITGHCGTVTSSNASIEMLRKRPPLQIARQPQSLFACENTSTTIFVETESDNSAVISYQWFHNGSPVSDNNLIQGSNGPVLLINSLNSSLTGNYYVTITAEDVETLKSDIATVTVNSMPKVKLNPQANISVVPSAYFKLAVQSENEDGVSYQWFKNNIEIENANSNTFEKNNVSEADAGTYYCKMSNQCSAVRSAFSNVSVTSFVNPNSVDDDSTATGAWMLMAPVPNPATDQTTIKIAVPVPGKIELSLNNSTGNKIADLFNGFTESGVKEVTFDINDLDLSNGVYFYTLKTDRVTLTNKLVIIK